MKVVKENEKKNNLVSWCFEPSQRLGVTEYQFWSITYSAHKSFNINHNISTAQLLQTYRDKHTKSQTFYITVQIFLHINWTREHKRTNHTTVDHLYNSGWLHVGFMLQQLITQVQFKRFKCRRDYRLNSFFLRTARERNELPQEIVDSQSFDISTARGSNQQSLQPLYTPSPTFNFFSSLFVFFLTPLYISKSQPFDGV